MSSTENLHTLRRPNILVQAAILAASENRKSSLASFSDLMTEEANLDTERKNGIATLSLIHI